MPRVVHFEIHADDPDRAVKFYGGVFGWKIEKWNGPMDYWLATTGPDDQPGINGAIMHRMNQGTVYNTMDVPSVDEFSKKIEAAVERRLRPRRPFPEWVGSSTVRIRKGMSSGSWRWILQLSRIRGWMHLLRQKNKVRSEAY